MNLCSGKTAKLKDLFPTERDCGFNAQLYSEFSNFFYESCSGSSWNLVIKCSNIDNFHSYFEISQVDIIELAPHR